MKKRIENIFTGVASNIVYGLLLLLVTYIGLKFDDKSLDDYLPVSYTHLRAHET